MKVLLIKQVSVFIENATGALADFSRTLGNSGIDMLAISIADTTEFGILRAIVSDYEKAEKVLKQSGFAVSLTDVIAVCVSDSPGGLADVLELLKANDISLEYIYSFLRHISGDAIIILRTNSPEEAMKLLNENNIKMLTQSQITQ